MSSSFSRDVSPRLVGATTALVLWSPLAAIVVGSSDPRGQALGVAGLIVSALIGSLLTSHAVMSRGLGARVALRFAAASVLAGSLLFGLLFAILDGHNPAFALGFALIGLFFLGIPLLILGFNLALIWVMVVRWLVRRTGTAGRAANSAGPTLKPGDDDGERHA